MNSEMMVEASATFEVSAHQLSLDLDLALSSPQDMPSPAIPTKQPLPTRLHSPQEVMLRSAIDQLLHDTAPEDDAFGYLRDVCSATLATRLCSHEDPLLVLREKSNSVSGQDDTTVASPREAELPRSPQDRLRALVPNAIEKGKSRYGQRAMQSDGGEFSRWKTFESEDHHPITDIACIFTGDAVPEGFTKIERSPTGQRADLNKGGGGVFIYLCVNRSRTSSKPPISEILAIFPERGEFVPTDYEMVQRRGAPANLNTGTQGERVYLCYKRSMNSSIVDVSILFPRKGDKLPYGYFKLDKSPDGFYADLNATTGGTEVCLSYKKKLHCLHELSSHWATTMSELLADKGEHSDAARCQVNTPSKTDEVRDTDVVEQITPLPSPTQSDAVQTISCELAEFFFYPLLLACYTRHGTVAEIAVQALSQSVDACMFDNSLQHSQLCRLDVVMEALTSLCHQGVKSRFAIALPFFRKVVRKFSSGFPPLILHATLKSLIFVGDFDTSLTKSVEDELVYKIMSRYEAERVEAQLRLCQQHRLSPIRTSQDIARVVVSDLVDQTINGVEIAKATEKLLGVFKSHASVQSPTFCSELSAALDASSGSTAQNNAFQLIITLTKSVSRKLNQTNDVGSERDQASIVNALRALNFALHAAGVNVRDDRAFGQMIRRIVFSTVNSTALMWSTDVFRASLTLISTLWNHYRRHVKVEFALLFEHLFLRILRSTSTGAVSNQMDIMDEIMPWFQLPHNVVEMFLNYDMERVQQWKIFEHLSGALCSIAEGSSSSTSTATTEDEIDTARTDLQIQAMTTILAIARSVMDASGHAHLINRDARTRLLSMEHGGWEQDEQEDDSDLAQMMPVTIPTSPSSSASPATSGEKAGSPEPKDKTPAGARRFNPRYGSINVRMRNELQKRNQQQLKRAMEIASAKSLKKAIEYLVAMNFVKETPRDITSFLRIYHDFFDETEIGDYLGEGDEDFKVQVRLTYVRAISFKGMTLVESLRHFLTNGGFRLPGEAQKIERMVEAFAQCFYEDSPASFSSPDTAMIIAYSIIMLNTDLHNPQVKKNKMSRDQFVKNNRGIDNGKDLPRKFLEEVYDDIAHNPMHIKGARFVPKSRESTLSLTDIDIDKFRTSVARSVTQSEELMRDLSQSYFTFHFVGVDASISPELIKVLFERVWFYLLALSTSILCDTQSDLTLTMQCLDLLRFSISTCLFLGMSVERRAFCNLLTKVHAMLEEDHHVPSVQGVEEDDHEGATVPATPAVTAEWIENIEAAASSDDPWRVMGDIHMLVNTMKETIQRLQRSEELHSVIKRINRGGFFLKDTTHFIREGDLTKKCRSRNQTYRFFLFNDQLLYADKGMSGYWNPHNSLRLKLTRVSDLPEGVMSKHAFQISNPVKSFTVYADSTHAKAEWMRLIEDAINEATKKVTINARRLSYRTMPSSAETEDSTTTKSMPSPGSPSALASTASTAVKNFMRRTSRLSSPVSEMYENPTTRTSEPTISPLVIDEEHVESITSDSSLDEMLLLAVPEKCDASDAHGHVPLRPETEAEMFANENQDQMRSLLALDASDQREL